MALKTCTKVFSATTFRRSLLVELSSRELFTAPFCCSFGSCGFRFQEDGVNGEWVLCFTRNSEGSPSLQKVSEQRFTLEGLRLPNASMHARAPRPFVVCNVSMVQDARTSEEGVPSKLALTTEHAPKNWIGIQRAHVNWRAI